MGAGSSSRSPIPGFRLGASSRTARLGRPTGVRCSYPVFSCAARHRRLTGGPDAVPLSRVRARGRHRTVIPHCRETPNSAPHPSSVRTTRLGSSSPGFRGPWGLPRSLGGFESRGACPARPKTSRLSRAPSSGAWPTAQAKPPRLAPANSRHLTRFSRYSSPPGPITTSRQEAQIVQS